MKDGKFAIRTESNKIKAVERDGHLYPKRDMAKRVKNILHV